jgi:hypothetical protein
MTYTLHEMITVSEFSYQRGKAEMKAHADRLADMLEQTKEALKSVGAPGVAELEATIRAYREATK